MSESPGFDEAVAFWQQVAQPIPIDQLDVGDVFRIEFYEDGERRERLVKLIGKWLTSEGRIQIQVDDTTEGEPKFTLVAKGSAREDL